MQRKFDAPTEAVLGLRHIEVCFHSIKTSRPPLAQREGEGELGKYLRLRFQ